VPPNPRTLGPGPCTGAEAFGHGAQRVHLWVDVDNPPSQAAARRAGFTQEGVVRAALDRRDGSRADAVLFGRLRSD
jgi:RimJ/RimL family protein N-acetyltransferase